MFAPAKTKVPSPDFVILAAGLFVGHPVAPPCPLTKGAFTFKVEFEPTVKFLFAGVSLPVPRP